MKNKICNIIIAVLFCACLFYFGIPSIQNAKFKYDENAGAKQNISVFETAFKENFEHRAEIVALHGYSQKLIGNDLVEDVAYGAMVRNDWGQITSTPEKSDLSALYEFVTRIDEQVRKQGGESLYIQAPFKILPSYEKLPLGVKSYANENADNLIKRLSDNGVSCFDLREVLVNSPLDKEKLFFKTDHHWTIDAAFYCYRQLASSLDYIKDKEFLTDENNYTRHMMENSFLGSWGRRTGEEYSGLDDFAYFEPNFETDFYVINRASGVEEVHRQGAFQDILMTKSWLEDTKEGKEGRYSLYLNGYTSEVLVENRKSKNNKKVLIFHDSFGFPLSAFMCLSAKNTTIIDVRAAFDKNIPDYIEETKPDMVLFIFNPDEADFVGLKNM